jgi:hypothetical protein
MISYLPSVVFSQHLATLHHIAAVHVKRDEAEVKSDVVDVATDNPIGLFVGVFALSLPCSSKLFPPTPSASLPP